MKRTFAIAFIVGYLSLLTYGNACHILRHNTGNHPLMYMIVWDMFCGWTAYDSRVHIIAEGESETFYDLSTPPWGEIHAFGYVGRGNYDSFNNHSGTLAMNVLNHTSHEPIRRILVIEEVFAKKLNLPDHVWNLRYDIPKDPKKYYHIRQEMLGDGTLVSKFPCKLTMEGNRMTLDNPRLQNEMNMGRSMFWNDRGSLVNDDDDDSLSPRNPLTAPQAN
jgi:hypothetical protein